jgi:starch phosphorylase
MNTRATPLSANDFSKLLTHRLEREVARHAGNADTTAWMKAAAHGTRELLAEAWLRTQREDRDSGARRAYYLSAEFLIGRAMSNALAALGLSESFGAALHALGANPADVLESEADAALGNGGLGRLAACFLDSLATLGVPSFGYGIRYEFGMFRQKIVDGNQTETPDNWLTYGNPWELPRPNISYRIGYGGRVRHSEGHADWKPNEIVLARAYDMIIPGHGTHRVSTLRLWSASTETPLDLQAHGRGAYYEAVAGRARAENLSWVLYPDDSTPYGRELRLRQEHFFVSASIQDIIARHLDEHGSLTTLHEKAAIQLNDTHPALSVPELMRLLMDVHGMGWEEAWAQTSRIVSYTNHTLMPEALEVWPMSIMEAVLPRHVQIISEINRRFIDSVHAKFPEDGALLNRVSLITHGQDPQIRMAYLSIVASHKVNGVAKLHSDLCVQTIFADFARIYPDRFTNVTNGVTPRRWLAQSNPGLAGLIDARLGREWRIRLDMLEGLASGADDAEFRAQVRAVKLDNKIRLANLIEQQTGLRVDPHALFDVQVKRIHEYKRQLLNLLHVVQRYREILEHPDKDWQPRVHLFAGKAASAYRTAKQIIRLIHDVAKVVNADGRIGDRLKVAFLPDYRVSQAEIIFPGADVSEQISTAGTEASGTGNMKFALNGALTVGTWDGANIEIAQHVGLDNIFIFGKRAEEIQALRNSGYHPRAWVDGNPDLRAVIDLIDSGHFSPDEPERYGDLMATVTDRDSYFLCADFSDYIAIQRRIDEAYQSPDMWTARVIRNIAAMGSFSSDRTIAEYCRKIWKIEPRH